MPTRVRTSPRKLAWPYSPAVTRAACPKILGACGVGWRPSYAGSLSADAERTLLNGCAIRPLDADGARAHLALAELYRDAGRLEDALAALQAVDAFAHAEPAVAALLGRLLADLGRDQEARGWLQVALEHDTEDTESRDLLRELRDEG